MAILRSPDNRLRLDLAVRAKGREAEVGTPAVRVVFDQRTLLNWSPLALTGKAGASGLWRLADAPVRKLNPRTDPSAGAAIEYIARFVSAETPTVTAQVAVRCACGGVSCQVGKKGER